MKNEKHKLKEIEVIRKEGDRLHILGRTFNRSFAHVTYALEDGKVGDVLREDYPRSWQSYLGLGSPFEWDNLVCKLREDNVDEIDRSVGIHQLPLDTVARNLGLNLEVVPAGGLDSCVTSRLGGTFGYGNEGAWIYTSPFVRLKARALELGAEHLVNCQVSEDYCVGTPVKAVKKKDR